MTADLFYRARPEFASRSRCCEPLPRIINDFVVGLPDLLLQLDEKCATAYLDIAVARVEAVL